MIQGKAGMTMQIGRKRFDFEEQAYVMGILNITPDSFSDGGRFLEEEQAVARGLAIEAEGGHLIDVGGESTKPGAQFVSPEEEIKRVLGPIRALVGKVSLPISVDTYKAKVAEAVLKAGASMINDVTGFFGDKTMAKVVAEFDVPVCIMMNRRLINSSGDVLKDLDLFFQQSLDRAEKAGIKQDRIILDPGIGFGLTSEESFQLIHQLGHLKKYGMPILLGASRKRIIWQTLGVNPTEGLEGTLATTAIGIFNGANLIRVHDVQENVKCALIADKILKNR